MFYNKETKEFAVELSNNYSHIYHILLSWFNHALNKSTGEVSFLTELTKMANHSFSLPNGFVMDITSQILHQKPYVIFDMNGKRERCELADLLVNVTYKCNSSVVETKSILYQAKVGHTNAANPSYVWHIQENQNFCLSEFPEMWFGSKKNAPKPASTMIVKPLTLEFGSYMLLSRGGSPAEWLDIPVRHQIINNFITYSAKAIRLNSSNNKFSPHYFSSAVRNFVKHILFEIGENHLNPEIAGFINKILSQANLTNIPIPTSCFITNQYSNDGIPIFNNDSYASDQGGFYVISITIQREENHNG